MPDSLPGKGFTQDDEKLTDYTLNQMAEGQIGKILVRKSGRMEVVIGQTKYDFDVEEPPQFAEDIMVMPSTENAGNYDTIVTKLKPVNDRFVLSPNWEDLFMQRKVKKKS